MPKVKFPSHLKKIQKTVIVLLCQQARMIMAKDLYSPEVTIGVEVLYQRGKCLSRLGSGYPSVLFIQYGLECCISFVL